MKKLLLAAGCVLGLLAARPAAAQYYMLPNLNANQNPGGVNTDDEYPVGGGLSTTWNTVFTGSAATFAAPVWTPAVAIPFAFQFNGQPETSFKVATSGVLTFNMAAVNVPGATNGTLPSAQLPDKSVAVWGMAANAGDYIVTKTFGTAPRRQFWVQFNSYSKPASTAIFTYWSIVLEEGTNSIYVVDQRTNATTGLNLTVGVQVNATTAVQVAASPNVNSLTQSGASPADNTYYTFNYGSQPARDLALRSLSVPSVVSRQVPVAVRGTLQNLGTQAVTSYSVAYQVNNQTPVVGAVPNVNIAPQGSAAVAHPTPWLPTQNGTYNLKVWLANPNGQPDQNPTNDTLRATVRVLEDSLRRFVVEECFTSSTCPPCLPGNQTVESVNRANPGKQLVIKYQQNFPAPGNDPYYTLEGRARFTYYGFSAIPYMTLDGGWNDNSNSFTAAALDQFYVVPVTMRIKGTYSRTNGNMVSSVATIRPFTAQPAGKLVAHMVITESRTVLNIRTNGETEFFHVMKKMLPNQNGTPLPALAAGQAYNLSQSFDVSTLPATQAVEHFDSLNVVVFVQDVVTKQVYQGAHMTLRNPLATKTTQTGPAFSLAPNPTTGRTNLFVTLPRAENVRVDVLDLLGRRVLTLAPQDLSAGPQVLPLNLAQQAAGIYTVRLTTSLGVSTSKLTLE